MTPSKSITIEELQDGRVRVIFGNQAHFKCFLKALKDDFFEEIGMVIWNIKKIKQCDHVQTECPHCKTKSKWLLIGEYDYNAYDKALSLLSIKVPDRNIIKRMEAIDIDPNIFSFHRCKQCNKIFLY